MEAHRAWIEQTLAKIRENCLVTETGCQVWQKASSGKGAGPKYGMSKVKFPWGMRAKAIRVHRLMYMLANSNFDLTSQLDVSHLCHNSLCVNEDHLSLEPHTVNNSRRHCLSTVPRTCVGHNQYEKCFQWGMIYK